MVIAKVMDFKIYSRAITHALLKPVLRKHNVQQRDIVLFIYFNFHEFLFHDYVVVAPHEQADG